MIQDLVHIPIRYPDYTTIDTECPSFNCTRDDEYTDQFGRSVDVGYIAQSGFAKYKSVEQIADTTIERMLITDQAIDFRKNWKTSSIAVWPVSAKVHTTPSLGVCDVCRYIKPITELINDHVGGASITGTTIHDLTLHRAMEYGYLFSPAVTQNPFIRNIVYGVDWENIDKYNNITHEGVADCDTGGWSCDILPHYPHDPHRMFFSHANLTAKELHKLCEPTLGVQHLADNVVTTDIPFAVDDNVICTEEYSSGVRPFFHDMIGLIETMACTDFILTVDQDTTVTFKFHSRYAGYKYCSPEQAVLIAEQVGLVGHVIMWATHALQALRIPTTVFHVTVTKNWNEEIFFLIQTPNKTLHYYVDITLYGLGSLSIM